jgi:glutathione synthase/RimK-type ligase-like ATP-grasp enzyme
MARYDITILTAEHYLDPVHPDWYVQQILLEDRILAEALEREGLRVHRIDWTNAAFRWNETSSAIIRSTWDYTNRFEEFHAFLHTAAAQTRLINPLSTVLWNLDKHYLSDLRKRGIGIPETIFIERYSTDTIADVFRNSGFTEAILKPAMSAGARHTYRLTADNLPGHEAIFRELIGNETMMLQPFLHSVVTHGEITLVVIGGRYTHAIHKKAKQGDFRVQDDFGGTVHHYTPTPEEIAFAERAVAACDPLPAYARVDILRDQDGHPVVSELEAIEPELWFRFFPPAAAKLAEHIVRQR